MSDIAAISLGTRVSSEILALKLQLQQDAAVVELVEKALDSPQQAGGPAAASDRLVDIVV